MRAGLLRHLVHLEAPAEGAQDSHGQPPDGWEPVTETYAQIEPLSGRELESARQVQARVTHRITIRFLEGVSPRMRVRYGERAFEIASVTNDGERDRTTVLMAVEVVG